MFELILKNSFSFSSNRIPDNNGWLLSKLTCCDQTFFGIDVQTSNVIVMFSVELLCFFEFVQNNSTCSCMVNDFVVPIVSEIRSCIVASVPVNVLNVKFLIWSTGSLDSFVIRIHLFGGLFPRRIRGGLIASLIIFCKVFSRHFMIERLFLSFN
jgi:hypothetical protein